jgi:hypothetical protein
MHGEFSEQHLEAMKKDIQTLIAQKTYKTVPRSEATRVIKSTWAFKLKRLPGGSASKFKARYRVRGEMQQEGVDYVFGDEAYKPKCTTPCKSLKDATPGDVIIPQSIVYEYNQACLKFAQMPKLSPRTKHISVPFHWFR